MTPPELAADAAAAGSGSTAAVVPPPPCAAPEALPRVADVLGTMRRRLEALNGPRSPRI
jgi:hypothetical protein